MNIVKIVASLKNKFSELYDVKHYRIKSSEQFVVMHYTLNNQKIALNKQK